MYCDACSSEFTQIMRHRVREDITRSIGSLPSHGSAKWPWISLPRHLEDPRVWNSAILRVKDGRVPLGSSSELGPILKESELSQVRQRVNEFSRQPGPQF